MQHLSTFQFQTSDIRTLLIDDHIYFVAVDIASTLGYTNPRKAVRDHCRKPKTAKDVGRNESFTLDPQTILILEPDMYRLISRSNLESAEAFQDWVFEDVLPSIRKTGSYTHPATLPQLSAPRYATFQTIARTYGFTQPRLNCALIRLGVGTIKGPYPDKEYYTAHTREDMPYPPSNILWNLDLLEPKLKAYLAPQPVCIPRLNDLIHCTVEEDRITTAQISKALRIPRSHLASYFRQLGLCKNVNFGRTLLGNSMWDNGWIYSELLNYLMKSQPKELVVL